eukprot:TRINITY_DN8372_c0_g1_i1.p1 TRINITY_DN8372_c0_g1~~TRINITY_DN8372_c0_g1_i1.p1  ORF type:complete len:491 (-),score=118.50 TRINITY_DN8372_c0_g1_i1:17-1366(-)
MCIRDRYMGNINTEQQQAQTPSQTMSDLLKNMQKKGRPPVQAFKLASTKQHEEDDEGDEDEEMKDSYDPDIHAKFTAPVPLPSRPPLGAKAPADRGADPSKPPLPGSDPEGIQIPKSRLKDYSPLKWEDYYDSMEYLEDGTTLYVGGKEGPLFVMLHGAGHSALSFACVAKEIKKFGIAAAFDFRGHGSSKKEGDPKDLSAETLVADALYVFQALEKRFPDPTFIVIGHSMGGSIATKAVEKAIATVPSLEKRLQGLIVIDVVEGTAIDALPFMEQIVNAMPPVFKTIDSAIQWSVKSGTIKNLESARVSVPAQLVERFSKDGKPNGYGWKVNLLDSQSHWIGWFKGLTQSFLNIRVPKLLVLAGSDRMDPELTIAQMQGKFRLVLFNNVGHAIQEDDPLAFSKACYGMLYKFKIPLSLKELELMHTIGIGKFHPELKPYDNAQIERKV